MAEPARKIREEIEPDIRPDLHVVKGGGETTPGRANLKALESNPDKTDSNSSIKDREEAGSNVVQGPWANKTTGRANDKSKAGGKFSFIKKKGPLTAIILTLVGGGVGIGGLLSPSLLLVNLKEVMTDKFNTQLTSMDIRTNKMIESKAISSFGVCGSVVSLNCKYSSMSDKLIERLGKEGIDVEVDGTTNILGRNRVTKITFDGDDILPDEFATKLATTPELRTSMKRAYNPLFASFSDKVWNKTLLEFKITEDGISFKGSTDEERLKEIQDTTSNPADIGEGTRPVREDFDSDEAFEDAAKRFDDNVDVAARNLDDIVDGAAEVTESGVKSASKTGSAIVGELVGVANILDYPDTACQVYGAARAVGIAAKTARAAQLAAFAMLFLKAADQIKAGDANPDDISYLGKILTTESIVTDETTGEVISKKSATDSFGYKYAAYGDLGEMPASSMQFMAGAGFAGTLIGITSTINSVLGGSPKVACKIINNFFVQAGGLAVGVAGATASGGVTVTIGAAIQGAAATAFSAALIYLPSLLKDIVAGVLVDENTVGELAGDAITSGTSGLLGTAAFNGGNAPLTVEQAVAYNKLSQQVAQQYAEEDRLVYSPLDASNKNTFAGMILSTLTPYLTKLNSVSSIVSSVGSFIFSSLASIIPTAKAADEAEFTMCEDYDYKDMGLATDPFCNLVYGVPVDDLQNISPLEVLDKMNGQFDEETGEPVAGSGYETFVKECMEREAPFGDTGDDFRGDDGSSCLINDSNPMNKYYYLFQIDQRVNSGLDDPDAAYSATSGGGSSSGGSVDPGDSSQPDNTISSNKGWTLKSDTDYSSVACADGTTDTGVFTTGKNNITVRVCQMPDGLTKVASLISKRTLNMINDAAEDGVTLTAKGQRSSFRSIDDQMYFREQNCPDPINSPSTACTPDTALPGSSMHERGLAIDFANSSRGSAVWNWLEDNAASYGYFNYPPENWHWSMSGS